MTFRWLKHGLAAMLVPVHLAAQCPDGTPPPCSRTSPPPPNSIAVLYFDNLSRDSTVSYLADGLTEELIVRLGRMSRLEVRTRSDARRVRASGTQRPAALGRSLNAAFLLMGSLQSFGGRSRVTVELVRSASGQRVWGDVFDGVGGDPLAVQQQIAVAVATAVVGELQPAERAGLVRGMTRDPLAYDLFLRARYFHDRSAMVDRYRAIALYEEALERDSTFAQAAAQLAYSWVDTWDPLVLGPGKWNRARRAALLALRLDSTMAEGYSALAWPTLYIEHDAMRAESLIRRAVALNARSPDAQFDLSAILAEEGRFEESIAAGRELFAVDSSSSFYASIQIRTLVDAGRIDEAERLLTRLRGIATDSATIVAATATVRRGEGRCRESLALYTLAAENTELSDAGIPLSEACLGDTVAVRQWLDHASSRATRVSPTAVASVWSAIGVPDSAMAWLERAESAGALQLFMLAERPFLPMRADPRFAALLGRYRITLQPR